MAGFSPGGWDEVSITASIMRGFLRDFSEDLRLDVAIAGAGPSGLTAARYLAREGFRVAVFERNQYVGGGIWGGGMLFPRVAVQAEAAHLFQEIGVRLEPAEDGLYIADAVEAVSRSAAAAIEAGAHIWVGMAVEDLVLREDDRVCGVVLNWMAVERAGLHVDPLAVHARAVIDATGHDAEVARTLKRKVPGLRLRTPTGDVVGERPMWSQVAEERLEGDTAEVHPGLIVAGMAAGAVQGSYRMGAIFGGMLLSGKRAAELAAEICRRDG
ncbi:MAG: sulfide-dependent adenosine diphosphate thiazole synthase [Candidatus Geothermincolales bacterium]